MAKRGKRYSEISQKVDNLKIYKPEEALELIFETKSAKFVETVELAVKLGVDPRHADQQVRGTVVLPHGTGKTVKILAITSGDNINKALEAGADFAGDDEYINKIQQGWFEFDLVIATPDMMPKLGKLGRILGTKGLMPNPKSGTVTTDVAKTVEEFKKGKVAFKVDKLGSIHLPIGKVNFEKEQIVENFNVEFIDVSFSYNGKKQVIKNLNLKFDEGAFNALVGESGSGKSTIAKLLAGFWNVESGHIKIGGIDVNNIPLKQLSKLISYVSQDNYLFDFSVKENIRLGNPNATDDEVEQIAIKAGCDRFIRELSHGYDTIVGEGGGHLSGGEKQRISIARAMLKNSPIIILDEATSYIDPENENIIQAAISKLVKGKTLIVIAHRLNTIKGADKIFVINNGMLENSGKHEELLEKSKLY